MRCSYCNSPDTKVLDKRDIEDAAVTRRRRQCLDCEKRFTTYERVEMRPLTVIKKDGKRDPFDREKLRKGVVYACWKRTITAEQIEALVHYVENKLRDLEAGEITSQKLGDLVMRRLKKLDKVAYIRFASIYREFADLEEFTKELDKLLKK